VSSHVFVLGVSISPLSSILPLSFGNVRTVWYFLFFDLLTCLSRLQSRLEHANDIKTHYINCIYLFFERDNEVYPDWMQPLHDRTNSVNVNLNFDSLVYLFMRLFRQINISPKSYVLCISLFIIYLTEIYRIKYLRLSVHDGQINIGLFLDDGFIQHNLVNRMYWYFTLTGLFTGVVFVAWEKKNFRSYNFSSDNYDLIYFDLLCQYSIFCQQTRSCCSIWYNKNTSNVWHQLKT
jgi:hypothetical protein